MAAILIIYSNIANTTILPHGKPEDVADEVRRKIAALAPGGGYIFSGGHNIQADVPPANIVALFDTASEAGRCPLGNYCRRARKVNKFGQKVLRPQDAEPLAEGAEPRR
jgi:hypothetical protein